jgi:predicted ArsR family transcriptional regulator
VSALQQQARALGDRTRYEIFRHIVDAGRPVGVAELAAHFEVHSNAVRQHLAKLVEAGLVLESTRRSAGPGRPSLQYVPHPAADSRWGVLGPYERLSVLLSEVIRTGDAPATVGRRAGVVMARRPVRADDPMTAMAEQLAGYGFEPTIKRRRADAVITLHSCPFATTALADPGTVCDLHLGIAQGFADVIGGVVVDELVPTDPRRPACRLRCHVEPTT